MKIVGLLILYPIWFVAGLVNEIAAIWICRLEGRPPYHNYSWMNK